MLQYLKEPQKNQPSIEFLHFIYEKNTEASSTDHIQLSLAFIKPSNVRMLLIETHFLSFYVFVSNYIESNLTNFNIYCPFKAAIKTLSVRGYKMDERHLDV